MGSRRRGARRMVMSVARRRHEMQFLLIVEQLLGNVMSIYREIFLISQQAAFFRNSQEKQIIQDNSIGSIWTPEIVRIRTNFLIY